MRKAIIVISLFIILSIALIACTNDTNINRVPLKDFFSGGIAYNCIDVVVKCDTSVLDVSFFGDKIVKEVIADSEYNYDTQTRKYLLILKRDTVFDLIYAVRKVENIPEVVEVSLIPIFEHFKVANGRCLCNWN